jgi:hypothetical protein
MANNPVVNTLTFTGSVAGQASIQAQGIAGGLTFLLPNTVPIQGQLMTATAINGNNVFLGFVSPQSSSISLSQITQSGATNGQTIEWNGSAWVPTSMVPGAGTVTSVALTTPAELSIAGSPITTSGTLALSWASGTGVGAQAKVIATPGGGGAGAYAGRVLVAGDIPALPYDASGAAAAVAAQLPSTFTAVSNEFLTSYTAGTPGVFTAAQATFAGLSGSLAVSQINSKRGNGGFVQIAASGTAGAAGDVVIFDANGNTVDSGILLSSLVPSTPGGSSGEIQYNNSGAFGGSAATIDAAGNLTIPNAAAITTAQIENPSGHQLSITAVDASNIAINGFNSSQILVNSAGAISITPASGQVATLNHVNTISAAAGGAGLNINSTAGNLIQIQANGKGTINLHGESTAGVEITNNAGGNSITVPDAGGIQISTGNSQSITLNASGGDIIANAPLFVDQRLDLSNGNAHIVPNTDNAGTVTILAGQTSILHNFDVSYGSTPIVVVTPAAGTWDTFTKFWVSAVGGSFTLFVDAAPAGNYTFNYIVMGN